MCLTSRLWSQMEPLSYSLQTLRLLILAPAYTYAVSDPYWDSRTLATLIYCSYPSIGDIGKTVVYACVMSLSIVQSMLELYSSRNK